MRPDLTQGGNYLNSLSFYPKLRFDIQYDDEEVLLLIREHPVTQIPWILNAIGLFIILVLLDLLIPNILTLNQLLFLNIFSLAAIGAYIWLNFIEWYYRVGLVTDIRVVDIDFQSILYKEITIAKLENVEDITTKSAGYISSLFNYGNVFIQTAGNDVNIEFYNAPDPTLIVRFINELTENLNNNGGNN